MEVNWQQTLAQLNAYIQHNPAVSIGSSIVCIPEEVRTEFYRLFDKVESDFVKQYIPGLIEKGTQLGTAWAGVSRAVIVQIPVESIAIAPGLRWFLNDAVDGLMRSLTDPLFEVLKGKMEIGVFEEKARRLIDNAFRDYFKEGYRRWAELAILNLLAADKSYRVPAVDEVADPLMGEGHELPGQHVAAVPEVEPSSTLSFQQNPVISYVTPKVIVWSMPLGRFVALHSEFVEPFWTARETSSNVEWYDFPALKANNGLTKIRPDQKIFPDLTRMLPDVAIFLSDDVNDVALVADHRRIMRPDLSVEVTEEADWFEKGKLDAVKRHHAVMKPRFGTFIICREPPPQAAIDALLPGPAAVVQPQGGSCAPAAETTLTPEPAAQPEPAPAAEPPLDIHIIAAGYDVSLLKPLIEALNKAGLPADGRSSIQPAASLESCQ